ncbi:unnamed protein product [Arctogadus glacialis]
MPALSGCKSPEQQSETLFLQLAFGIPVLPQIHSSPELLFRLGVSPLVVLCTVPVNQPDKMSCDKPEECMPEGECEDRGKGCDKGKGMDGDSDGRLDPAQLPPLTWKDLSKCSAFAQSLCLSLLPPSLALCPCSRSRMRQTGNDPLHPPVPEWNPNGSHEGTSLPPAALSWLVGFTLAAGGSHSL